MRPAPGAGHVSALPVLLLPLLAVGLSYGLGGVLGADLVARWRGLDLRRIGSGNPGATNVYRAAGILPALVVLLWDAGKGWVAVRLPLWMDCEHAALVTSACALAVLLGHVHPPWGRRARGGKGVATFLGILLAFAPMAAAVFALVWAVVFAARRYVSLASLLAGAAAVVVWGELAKPGDVLLAWVTGVLAYALVLWRHRENIHRLYTGQEHRVTRLRTDGR